VKTGQKGGYQAPKKKTQGLNQSEKKIKYQKEDQQERGGRTAGTSEIKTQKKKVRKSPKNDQKKEERKRKNQRKNRILTSQQMEPSRTEKKETEAKDKFTCNRGAEESKKRQYRKA